jgi:hypothetical protein
MNKNIESAIEKISTSFPSLYSKEDVIKVLQDLNREMESEPGINLEVLVKSFKSSFEDVDFEDFIEKDDVELSLSYDNRIEVERVPVDEYSLVERAVSILEEVVEALKYEPEDDYLIDESINSEG